MSERASEGEVGWWGGVERGRERGGGYRESRSTNKNSLFLLASFDSFFSLLSALLFHSFLQLALTRAHKGQGTRPRNSNRLGPREMAATAAVATSNGSDDARVYSLDEMRKHTTEESCWIAVRGEVFDVTPFIDEHPGGFDIIISNTGKREKERRE